MVRIAVALALLVTAIVAPGCGSPTPVGASGSVEAGEVTVDYEDVGGAHVFMTSPCPQPVGSMLLTNTGSGPVTVQVTTPSSQLSLTGGGPIELAMGETAVVEIDFNCSNTADIATEITITVTDAGGSASTATVPFALDVQGAPGG